MWTAGVMGAASLVLFLLSVSILIPTFNMSFFKYQNKKNGTYEHVKMEENDLLEVTRHMLRYMSGKEKQLNIETNVNGEKRMFFSEREIMHMEDVKDLYSVCFVVRNVTFVLFAAVITLMIVKKKIKFFANCVKYACISSFSLIAVLIAVIAFNFERAFEIFHKIFFNNDMWLLDLDTDLLINILPESFFIDIAVFIAAIFVGSLIAVTAASFISVKKVK